MNKHLSIIVMILLFISLATSKVICEKNPSSLGGLFIHDFDHPNNELHSWNGSYIDATIIVPSIKLPKHRFRGKWYGAAALEIGGDAVDGPSIQGGFEWTIDRRFGHSTITYQIYTRFAPDPTKYNATALSLEAGDELFISVRATSSTEGIVYMKNKSKNLEFHYRPEPTDKTGGALNGHTAKWFVQRTRDAFANFGEVLFKDIHARAFDKEIETKLDKTFSHIDISGTIGQYGTQTKLVNGNHDLRVTYIETKDRTCSENDDGGSA